MNASTGKEILLTRPFLIWQPDIFPDSEKKIAEEFFEVFDLNISKRPTIEDGVCFAYRGSTSAASLVRLNLNRYDMRNWVPYLRGWMLSKNYLWTNAASIGEQANIVTTHDPLFIRPDSAKKIFPGQVYTQQKWQEELAYLRQRNADKILCFVAAPERIVGEYRCLFVGEKFVGASLYMTGGEDIVENPTEGAPIEAVNLAKEIRRNEYFYPEENVTIDIAECPGREFKLVEINFLETSGWYGVNPRNVYSELIKQFV